MAAAVPISGAALRVGQSLVQGAAKFRSGMNATAQFGRDYVDRTATKLRQANKKSKAAKEKNDRLKEKYRQDDNRKAKEERGERKGKFTKSLVRAVVVKPLKSLWGLIAAWVIQELPRLLKEIGIITKKVRVFSAAVKAAVKATGTVFTGLLNITKAFLKNISEFDFNDTSGRIEDATKELDDGMEEVNSSFEEMKNVWNRNEEELDVMIKKLERGEGLDQAIKGAMSQLPQTYPQTSAVGTGSRGPSAGKEGWGPILELIAQAESVGGSYDSVYPGTIKPGLSSMTIGEADAWQARTASERGSAAAGRYQFMTILDQARNAGLGPGDIFSPENQDKMAIALIEKKKMVSVDMIKDNPIEAARRLSQEWAGLPVLSATKGASRNISRGQSYYAGDGLNKATVSPEQLTGAFSQVNENTEKRGGGNIQAPQAAPGGKAGEYELFEKIPFEQFSKSRAEGGSGPVGKTSDFGPRVSPGGIGSTDHKGIDIGTSGGAGYYVAGLVNGTVTFSGTAGGYGIMVEIRSGRYTYRYAHLRKALVKSGQKYSSGMPIGEIGNTGNSTGEHLHYEVLVGGKHINPESFLKLIEIGRLRKKSSSTAANTNGTATPRAQSVATAAASLRTNQQGMQKTVFIRQTNTILA